MIKIAAVNIKGGVGKSMFLYQVGSILSERGKNVLLVDGDPQHNITKACLSKEFLRKNNLGKKNDKEVKFGLYELLTNECAIKDVLIQPYPESDSLSNLYLIPSNYDLFMYEKDTTIKNQSFELKEKLSVLKNFDYILVDTNPSISFLLTSILTYVDNIISVFDASTDAIDGFEYLKDNLIKVIQQTTNRNLSIKGIVLNNHKIDSGFSKDIIQIVDKLFPKLRFNTVIKGLYINKESRAFSNPLIEYARRNQSTLQWIDLTTEIIKRIG